jgi:hypothetical protein
LLLYRSVLADSGASPIYAFTLPNLDADPRADSISDAPTDRDPTPHIHTIHHSYATPWSKCYIHSHAYLHLYTHPHAHRHGHADQHE